MEIYQVGPDTPYDFDKINPEQYVWVVYWYEDGGYDGSGEVLALRKDGKLDSGNLGHCSCYGPLDSWPESTYEVEEIVNGPNNIHDNDFAKVKPKVLELLGR